MKNLLFFLFLMITASCFTQNFVDSQGLKQGKWAVKSVDTLISIPITYSTTYDSIIEYKNYNSLEGEYLDGKKVGVWISRNSYRNTLSTITFENGKPYGEVVVYYYQKSIRYKGFIKKDNETVKLDTKASAGKYWATIIMDVDELIEKWTMINKLK